VTGLRIAGPEEAVRTKIPYQRGGDFFLRLSSRWNCLGWVVLWDGACWGWGCMNWIAEVFREDGISIHSQSRVKFQPATIKTQRSRFEAREE